MLCSFSIYSEYEAFKTVISFLPLHAEVIQYILPPHSATYVDQTSDTFYISEQLPLTATLPVRSPIPVFPPISPICIVLKICHMVVLPKDIILINEKHSCF